MRAALSCFVALVLVVSARPAIAAPREIVDAGGRTVFVASTDRVVSLGGSITEILYALGLEDRIAAVDTTSLFPPRALAEKPNVGYLRTLSAEGVLSVAPSLILAEEDAGPQAVVTLLEGASVPFVRVPSGMSAEGITAKIRFIGGVMGVAERANAMADEVAADFVTLGEEIAGIGKPVRALFVLSLTGGRIMAAGEGTAAEAILRLAGGRNALSGFTRYKPVNAEAVLEAAPDAIVVMKREGEGPGPGIAMAEVLADPTLAATPAGKAGNVIAMNGLYLLGFGPRTAHAAHDLAAALYPEQRFAPLPARAWTDASSLGE